MGSFGNRKKTSSFFTSFASIFLMNWLSSFLQSRISSSRTSASKRAPDKLCWPSLSAFSITTTDSLLPFLLSNCFNLIAPAKLAGPAPTNNTSVVFNVASFVVSIFGYTYTPFNAWIRSGIIVSRSPTMPKSAALKMRAFDSLFIASITLEFCIPVMCCTAPEIPTAT